MLPITGIEQQAVNPLYLPGNTFYVFSVERVQWRGSQARDVVFGGASLPRMVFLPIVDFPQMGKNFNPVGSYQQAHAEISDALQRANASRIDGGLPMTRKLAISCVQEIIENYRSLGATDLPLTNMPREKVGQLYMSVLPDYVTRPGLAGIKRAIVQGDDGKPRFYVNEVTMVDSKGHEAEFDLHRLLNDIDGKLHAQLSPELHQVAATVQGAIYKAVENAIAYRSEWIDKETAEISASKSNGGRGLSSYTHRAKRYAVSLGLELIDPVVVQRKEFVKETMQAAPANENNGKLADALNNFATAIHSMQLQVQPPAPQAEPEKPKAKAKAKTETD